MVVVMTTTTVTPDDDDGEDDGGGGGVKVVKAVGVEISVDHRAWLEHKA
jgi:hypothetical protein